MPLLYFDQIPSPIGVLTVAANAQGIRHILFAEHRHDAHCRNGWQHAPQTPLLQHACTQLLEYLHGQRRVFELPLAPIGTAFQLEVWQALAQIPFGHTWSYMELARAIDRPNASRAVGAANGCNPLPIVLPCHRVIGAHGHLTGFGGGLPTKAALLKLENVAVSACGTHLLKRSG